MVKSFGFLVGEKVATDLPGMPTDAGILNAVYNMVTHSMGEREANRMMLSVDFTRDAVKGYRSVQEKQ